MVSVLGLSYEPHTDDMRAAPSLGLVAELVQLVGDVRVWDPLLPPAVIETLFPSTTRCKTIEQAVDGSGVVIVLTEFPEVRDADWKAIADRVVHPALVIDGKNCLDVSRVTGAGLGYRGMGRPPGSESLASP